MLTFAKDLKKNNVINLKKGFRMTSDKKTFIDLSIPTSDIMERTPWMKQYFADIRKFDVLSQEEEERLFYKMSNGTKAERLQARNKIIECNQRFIFAIAKRYGKSDNVSDLVAEGNLALIEAIEEYDYTRGNRFLTYAVHYIRRNINNYLMNDDKLVKRSNISKTYHTIAKARNAFIQKEQRNPSTEELKEILEDEYGVTIKQNIDLIDTSIASLDEHFNNDDEEATSGDLVLFTSKQSSSNGFERTEDNEFSSELIKSLLDSLQGKEAERAKEIVKMVFGIGYTYPVSIEDIADKFELTEVRVRQICNETILKLKKESHEVLKQMV